MRPIGSSTRTRPRRAEAPAFRVALAALVLAILGSAPAAAQTPTMESGEQPLESTLVYPPFAHTLGIHRARPAHLKLFLGDRTRFDDPQGVAAVKFTFDDDPDARGDDFQLTLLGVNAGRGEILYNSSMQTLAVYGRIGSGEDEFQGPHGIAATVDGRVYVADTGNRRVVRLRWDPESHALRWNGSWPAGVPFDVEADARGSVWVTDRDADAVLRFADGEAEPDMTERPPLASGDRWPLPDDVDAPLGLAISDSLDAWFRPNANRLYLVDRDGRRLRAYEPGGTVVASIEPGDVAPGRDSARFLYVELDYFGNVYVSDPEGGAIYKLDPDLHPLTVFTGPGPPESALEEPRGIAIWKRFGQVFVAEREGAQYFFVGTDFRPIEEPLRVRRGAEGGPWALDLFLTEPATVRLAFLGGSGDTLAVADAGMVGEGSQAIGWDASDWQSPPVEGWSQRAERLVVEARPTYSSRRRFARVRDFPLLWMDS